MILDNQPRLCLFCQDPYTSDRSTGLYCSDDCKDAFHNRKKKLRRLELKRKAWIESLPRPEFPSGKLLESVRAYLEKHNPQVLAGLQKDQKDFEQLRSRQQIVLQKAQPFLVKSGSRQRKESEGRLPGFGSPIQLRGRIMVIRAPLPGAYSTAGSAGKPTRGQGMTFMLIPR